jgi:sarcosine oxidase
LIDFTQPLKALRRVIEGQISQERTASTKFDIIVIGVGSMGSAACYHASKAGAKVLGIEQFDLGHQLGSHGGQSRIIREAYFEHPNYVPLLRRSYENWRQLEKEAQTDLMQLNGLLYMGKPGGTLIEGVNLSAGLYDIPVENIKDTPKSDLYKAFKLPADYEVLYEPGAGFVRPEKAILCHTGLAIEAGAEIRTDEKVLNWHEKKGKVFIETDKAAYSCQKLIITAGPWASDMLPNFSKHLQVSRQLITWVKPKDPALFKPELFPCWTLEVAEMNGIFYGFPLIDSGETGLSEGLKIGYHWSERYIQDVSAIDRSALPEEIDEVTEFMKRFMPDVNDELYETHVCMYTNTPDSDFIIDYLPNNKHVVFATGFSGHGYKFAALIGEILSDLVLTGKTTESIDFLSLSRLD